MKHSQNPEFSQLNKVCKMWLLATRIHTHDTIAPGMSYLACQDGLDMFAFVAVDAQTAGPYSANPTLLRLPLFLWFSLLSSQFQWPVTFCISSFMQPACSASLGRQLWIHPEDKLPLHLHPAAAFLGSQLRGPTQSLHPRCTAGLTTVISQHRPHGLLDVKSAIS